ncbi:hypothetical protein DM02DRAFT_706092 [Periconia macrospinosa]|uniref:Uncharacterized protein n=1 Tax=Periconia macrospinosa TaxID=97972 RepID=A0A2V1DVK5_9PLEO|nr:hypothetical protein DM02DRAFT_706092 [Periconia macrospinosa]
MEPKLVKSRLPLIPEHTKLPPLDQIESRLIVPILLVFRLESCDGQDAIIQDLQDGLATTIEEIPFIAGHVVPDDKRRGTIQLVVEEADGVWFHAKEIPEMTFDELEHRRFSPVCFPIASLMPEPRLHDWEKSPVLTVQATFITGGMLLLLSTHHSVMDGKGMSMMIKIWAKNVEAASQGLLPSEFIESDLSDRSPVFEDGSRSMHLTSIPNYRLTKQVWRSALQRELLAAAVTGDLSHPRLSLLRELELSFWTIPRESLQAIKHGALASPDTPVPTENMLLSALLWRHITRARRLSARGIHSTSLVNVIDIRRRLEPPLPHDYLGNALAHAKTNASALDVESNKPLYELAQQITESIDWWTSERMWGFIGAVDSTQHVAKPCMDNFKGADLEVTNMRSYGDSMEGQWGPALAKAVALRTPYIATYDGWVSVFPSREDGAAEFIIVGERTTLDRLKRDAEWRSLAQLHQ